MPQQGITFNGAFIGLPGAYYGDNVSAGGFYPPPVTPPMVFIGYGWGPAPKVPQYFTNPQNLLTALRGGPASNFVQFMANPSPIQNGAQQITFIDASENTQSQAALFGAPVTSGAVLLTMTSVLYGPPSNRMQYQVSNASVQGYKLAIIDNYAGTQIIGDNLGVPFQIAYTGLATGGVTYGSPAPSGGAVGTFTINSPISGESVVFTTGSGNIATCAQLVQAINGTSIAVAQLLSASNGGMSPTLLTALTGVALPIPSGAGSNLLTYIGVRATQQDPLYWINNYASNFVTASAGPAALDKQNYTPSNTNLTYFSGALGVPPVNNDYALALNVALGVPAWTVFCDSNSTAVQTLLAQHVETASSSPYGAWRRGFTGSTAGDSLTTSVTNAQYLDSIQMCYVYPGIYRINLNTGANMLFGGLYAAAAAAAIATGNQIALPLTNKILNGTGVEAPGGTTLTQSQLVTLQNAGIMALWAPPQTKVPTILSDITTWQADSNVENTSSQQVACRYWLAYSCTNVLANYVGTIASPTQEADILRALTALLNSLIYTGTGSNGVLASWNTGSLQLVYNGATQTASITFQATLVGQNRYITCYATIEPLNFTLSSSTIT